MQTNYILGMLLMRRLLRKGIESNLGACRFRERMNGERQRPSFIQRIQQKWNLENYESFWDSPHSKCTPALEAIMSLSSLCKRSHLTSAPQGRLSLCPANLIPAPSGPRLTVSLAQMSFNDSQSFAVRVEEAIICR